MIEVEIEEAAREEEEEDGAAVALLLLNCRTAVTGAIILRKLRPETARERE